MLFSSYQFIFIYLPIVFLGFFWIAKSSYRLAALWLAAASVFFYGFWNPKFILLLLSSIFFNYGIGYAIGHAQGARKNAKILLIAAIAADLALLGIFKYKNFFITSVNSITGLGFPTADIVLPLGISFFTFTQIAFLVDVYRGIAREYNFIHYLLFVTYFPHLIAGPVLHHKQMMPQFASLSTYRMNADNITMGLTIFIIGLAKKVLLADSFAEYATPMFDAARDGTSPQFFVAWIGSLSYALQLYFDFSGYSDMAIGLSKLFGVDLPINFNSPYKAHNIIEFWRRWHMTLSQFLRDYLYIPLGGNRNGRIRRHINLMITMLLGGLWHGANWTFVLWGGLHGAYLVINHAWLTAKIRIGFSSSNPTVVSKILGIALTFISVTVAWVFFRSESLDAAIRVIQGMSGWNGVSFPSALAQLSHYLPPSSKFNGFFAISNNNLGYLTNDPLWFVFSILLFGLVVVFIFPNSSTITQRIHNLRSSNFVASLAALAIGGLLGLSLLAMRRVSEFLYFRF